MTLSRREMLKVSALGLVGTAGIGAMGGIPFGNPLLAREAGALDVSQLPRPFAARFTRPPVLKPINWEYDETGRLVRQVYEVTAKEGLANIIPGFRTRLWGYNGLVPGPTIKVPQGVEATLRVRNRLPATHPLFGHDFNTSTHLHGSASLPQYDGYADDISHPGDYKDYQYPNWQPARTIWYHDHAVHTTAMNAYSGLAAQYHIHDRIERRLLPQGEFDVPLTVTDAMFAADGQLTYDDESQSGLYGDVILVNGRPWPTMKVKRRVYRFRILVASISRSYRWQLGAGDPLHIVATDSGLMPRTQTVTQFRHGASERYEVLIDFRNYRPGQQVILQNLSNDNNRDYDHTDKVMAFEILDDSSGAGQFDRSDPTWNRIPDRLMNSHPMSLRPEQSVANRHLELGRTGSEWTINDLTWSAVAASGFQDVVADPGLGDVEIWTLENSSGGWFHPLHIHLIDFKVLDRNGAPPMPHELGPKDVVYLGENETVRVLAQFGDRKRPEAQGRYMVHCHNLVHEDHDMMVQFAVGWKPGEVDVNDPIHADPCKVDDLPELDCVAPGPCDRPEAESGPGEVELRWKEPDDDGDGEILRYRIRGWAAGAPNVDLEVPAKRRRHTVTGLVPGRAYRFSVQAINDAGAGPQSGRSRGVTPRVLDRRRPRVVARTPDVGATRVNPRRNISILLSEAVTGVPTGAVVLREAGGRRVPVDLDYRDGGRRIVVNPRRPLKRDTRYVVRVSRRIRDASGNRLRADRWSFTTR
ncbi:MAG TPA: multicopper oxidase domain-containing protein [Nocardioidaceae bacterium]|nr:multicopper oxidase domain-containing protein [Nocardioidaceae bacterium]